MLQQNPSRRNLLKRYSACLLVGLSGIFHPLQGQELATPTTISTDSLPLSPSGADSTEVTTPSTTSTTPSPSGTGFNGTAGSAAQPGPSLAGGKIPFHITAVLAEIYDDNIFIQPHKSSDFITNLSVEGEVRFGSKDATDSNYLDAFYQPTLLVYARHSSEDAVNQDVDVFYQHKFTRLTLSLEQAYAKTESTNAAIGNLVTSDVYTTGAKADYSYSDKLDLNAAFTQSITDYENPGYTSTNEWVGDLYFLYRLDQKLSIGLGPEFGFLDIQQAPNQTYQQLLAHLSYVYSGKLNFTGAAGAEYREYEGDSHGDTLAPVFELSGTYSPTNTSQITLAGSRHYVPSYNFIGQDYISTSVSLTASQRFLEKYTFALALGYENDSYEFDAPGLIGATREDNFFYVSPSVSWRPNDWLSVSASYRYQNDDSNFDAYNFNDNQVSLSLTATY
jgi:hypothetical protein